MCRVRDFDVRCRGASTLIDEWKVQHEEVQRVWQAEDIVREYNRCIEIAKSVYEHFRESDMPECNYRFTDFVSILEAFVARASQVEERVAIFERRNYGLEGAEELRNGIAALMQIIEEDRFATQAAFLEL